MDDTKLIQRFIENENYALSRSMQGDFYPGNWHKIGPLTKKALNNIPDENKTEFFFHLLRIKGPGFIPHKNNFSLYKRAFRQLLELAHAKGSAIKVDALRAVVLFEAYQFDDRCIKYLNETSHEDFIRFTKIVAQCNKYSSLSAMCKKYEYFIPFAQDSYVVKRCIVALNKVCGSHHAPIPNKDFLYWGIVLILILDKCKEAMATINECIRCCPYREYMYAFGQFLDFLSKDMVVDDIKKTLYEHHPKEWIDVKDENWIQNYF